jgi:hypothetical protein
MLRRGPPPRSPPRGERSPAGSGRDGRAIAADSRGAAPRVRGLASRPGRAERRRRRWGGAATRRSSGELSRTQTRCGSGGIRRLGGGAWTARGVRGGRSSPFRSFLRSFRVRPGLASLCEGRPPPALAEVQPPRLESSAEHCSVVADPRRRWPGRGDPDTRGECSGCAASCVPPAIRFARGHCSVPSVFGEAARAAISSSSVHPGIPFAISPSSRAAALGLIR